MYQILRQLRLQFVYRDGDAEFAGLRDAQSGLAARVDVGERGQVHVHVQHKAVIAAAVLDLQSQRGVFAFADIPAGRILAALRSHAEFAEQVDYRLLHQAHQFAHIDLPAAQVEQQVGDDLAGAVIGDLSAAIDLYYRDVRAVQQVFRFARRALGETGGVLPQPYLVARLGPALGGEALHRIPGRLILDQAQ